MAAKETVNSNTAEVEPVVNRWVVDYYASLALELFENEQYVDFGVIRTVLDSILGRPCEDTDSLQLKIPILKFLSRINEGENLDMSFGPDESLSPLESALLVLEDIKQDYNIPQQEFDNVCTSLKEMIVVIFIKNDEFDQAKEVLNKHFPKPMVGKKAIFMGLIRKRSKIHKIIEQSNFQPFKKDMMAFCRKVCPFNVPFLHKAAKVFNDKRLTEQDGEVAVPDEQDEAGPSTSPQIDLCLCVPCFYAINQRTRLVAVYEELAASSDERTFAQLEEEVEREEQAEKEEISLPPSPRKDATQSSEQEVVFQRDSGSPMEASPADETPQADAVTEPQAGSRSQTPPVLRSRRPYTVARLVVELDSQQSSQCTPASQELETEPKIVDTPQSPAIPNNKHLQSPVTDTEVATPTRKRRSRANRTAPGASTSVAESADSEEDPPHSSNRSQSKHSTTSKQASSDSEEDLQESPAAYKTPAQTPRQELPESSPSKKSRASPPERATDRTTRASRQTAGLDRAAGRGTSVVSKLTSSHSEEDLQESPTACKTPVRTPPKQQTDSSHKSKGSANSDKVCITDVSLDSSPSLVPHNPVPQTSSTPHRDSAQDKDPSASKWKKLFSNAKESKEMWSDEDEYFVSKKDSGTHNESTFSGHRKRRWTDDETRKLIEGVQKFGEGNWSKIKSYYSFHNRTNVNLKDRWRTMKKQNMV